MVPFSIRCTTCRAVLRVTNAVAIGEILPCPRCGSMVHVVPPIETAAVVTESLNAPMVGVPAVFALITAPLGSASVHVIEEIAADAAGLLPDGAAASVGARPPTPPPLPAAAASAAAIDAHAAKVTTGGSAVLFAASAAGLICVAAIAWGTWSYFGNDETGTVAQSSAEHKNNAEESDPSPRIADAGASDKPPTLDSQAGGNAEHTASDVARATEPTSAPAEQANAKNSDGAAGPIDKGRSPELPLRGSNGESSPPPHTDVAAAPARQNDSAQAEPPPSDARVVRKPSLEMRELPKVPPLVTDAVAPQSAGDQAAKAQDDKNAEPPAENDLPPRPAPPPDGERPLRRIASRQVDVPARLATAIAAVEFHDAPLHRFAQTISDLSGVTISLDADALRARGIQIDEPVSVAAKSATLGAILQQALRPLGLAASEKQGQLLIAPVDTARTRRARYAVDDLVRAGDPPIEELAAMMRTLIGRRVEAGDAAANNLEVASGAIFLSGAEVEHDRMIELCEKLRVARGRPLRSRFDAARPDPRFDPRRFELATRHARASELLARRVTAGIGRPAPLSDSAAYLAEQTRATILIDAQALAAAGLSDGTESRLRAADEPLETALARLLEPLELSYRLLYGSVLEITTRQAAAERPYIEFYPVRGLVRARALDTADAEKLRERLLVAGGLEESTSTVVFDPPSQCLIVAAPYAEHVRLEQAIAAAQ